MRRDNSHRRAPRLPKVGRLHLEPLEARRLLAGDVFITELMAENATTLADEDGHFSDWFELQNLGDTTAAIDGWHLTDDAADPTKWALPTVSLDPQQTLIVFASGKDRRVWPGELHTNFALPAAGGYLALNDPAGQAHQVIADYPYQVVDVSFGLASGTSQTALVAEGDTANVLVPLAPADMPADWNTAAFDDSSWAAAANGASGPTGIGFETIAPAPVARGDGPGGIGTTDGTSELQLWFDAADLSLADGAAVTNWTDASGSGHDGVQAGATVQPSLQTDELNGLPVVRFDADHFGTVNLDAQNGEITFVAVIKPDTGVGHYHNIIDDTALNRPMLWVDSGETYELNFGFGTPGSAQRPAIRSGPGGWDIVFAVTRNGADSELYVNSPSVTHFAPGSLANPTSEDFSLFHRVTSGAGEAFHGDVAELIIYDTALDGEEIGAVGAYLQHKYDLQVGFAATEPDPLPIATDIAAQMAGQNSTALVRVPFTASQTAAIDQLTLDVQYDDGFAAYLNGQQIALRNAPGGVLPWNAAALTSRDNAAVHQVQSINVSAYLDQLVDGPNVLAFHALNAAVDDGDFLLLPELIATDHAAIDASASPQYLDQPTPGTLNTEGSGGVRRVDGVAITEFVALNNGSLLDEDGDDSDWIELFNPNPYPVDLNNAYLTDDATDLTGWQFPRGAVVPAEGYLSVFASGKDRNRGELHTDFRLASEGEYLALVAADGATILSQFGPAVPAQFPDVSYGQAVSVVDTTLIAPGDTANVLAPTTPGDIPAGWTEATFDDSSWLAAANGTSGPTGVGYNATGPAPAPIADPTDILGHVLWLDGNDADGDGAPDSGTSGTAVGTWVDKSSGLGVNSVSTTAGNPTQQFNVQGGNATVRFTGRSLDKLDNADFFLPTPYTVLAVVRNDRNDTSTHLLSGIDQAGTDEVLYRNVDSWRFHDGGAADQQIAASADTTGFHLFGMQVDPAGENLGFFDGAVTSGLTWTASATLDGLRVGNVSRGPAGQSSEAEAWGGDVAELIIYDSALSQSDRDQVVLYLADKWNLDVALPTGAATEIERGRVSGGTPSTLLPSANTLGAVNVARDSAGGVAFAQDEIGGGRDFRPYRAIDGQYADPTQGAPPAQEPWIGALADTFLGVKLAGPTTIEMIGFANQFAGRRDGQYALQYTTDSFAALTTDADLGFTPVEVAALDWRSIDVVQIADAVDTRHLYGFDPIAGVTGVRLVLQAAGGQIGVSELEVWSGASTAPGDRVLVESIDTNDFNPTTNPGSFEFATIGRPSDADFADQNNGNGVVVSVAPGSAATTHGNSAAVTALNDGVIMDANVDCCAAGNQGPNGQRDAFFFSDGVEEGRVLMSFPGVADVEKIVSFAGIDDCCLNRGEQNYTVFGSAAAAPDTTGDLFANADWQPIATVHAGPQNQTAIEITSSSGSLGVYRHLLWDVHADGDGIHDFFGELDVYTTIDVDPLIATDVESLMYQQASTALLRIPFTVADPGALDRLALSMQYDDGFVAYLNGQEVARGNVPGATGDPLAHDAVAPAAHSPIAVESFDLSPWLALLEPGPVANVLAIHAVNLALDDFDLLVLPELVASEIVAAAQPRHFITPTPGGPNGIGVDDRGPVIGQVQHAPAQPAAGDDLVVTAAVTPLGSALDSVALTYRVMFGPETTVPMVDDGTGVDAVAGDGVFSTAIDSAEYAAGEMVRFFVSAADTAGNPSRWPLLYDLQGQDQAAVYHGTVVDDAVTTQLPRLHWFVENVAAAENPNKSGTRASIFFDGEFYDNVFVRTRGATSLTVAKKSFKFDFAPGRFFRYDDAAPRVEEININTTFQDKSYVREDLAYQAFADAGVPSSDAFNVRVERNGAFFSVAMFVEQVDEIFLERRDLDTEGALYKMFNGITSATVNVEKKTRLDEGHADLQQLVAGLAATNPERDLYLFDHIDIPAAINYAVSGILAQDFDRGAKNFYVYRDTNGSGEWTQLPWDQDLTMGNRFFSDEISGNGDRGFGMRSHPFYGESEHQLFGTNMMIDALIDNPLTREMYLRRLRTLMDELLQPPETPYGDRLYEQRLDQFLATTTPDTAEDLAAWGAIYGIVRDFPTAIGLIKTNYLDERRDHLYVTHSVDNVGGVDVAGIPHAQVTHPAIAFGTIEGNPAGGDQDEEFIELVNNNDEAVDISGWRLTGGVSHTFRPGTVIPAHGTLYVSPNVVAFRARAVSPTGGEGRFVQGNYAGHISNLGEQIDLLAGDGTPIASIVTPVDPSPQQTHLRISEIMYHPAAPTAAEQVAGFTDDDDFEYVELVNASEIDTLDLTGVAFTQGIDFALPDGTTLGPGQRLLVVRNIAAFTERYDTAGLHIAGEYQDPIDGSNRLSNGGETVKLEDAQNGTIHEFRYDDAPGWPAAADGRGSSLEVVNTASDYDEPTTWYASPQMGGSPGVAAAALVLDRLIFYHDSAYDTASEDDAIALDKHALLPGQTATTANITNYDGGTNGVMLDVANPANRAALGAGDFSLLVGNTNDTGAWTAAGTPLVTVRNGAGRGGSDRVVLRWPTDAPTNTWLQVVLRSDAPNTGLLADDVFFTGNAVGEVGNDPAGALVTAADVIAIRDHFRGPGNRADITTPHDVNRDRLVDATDVILARNHSTGPFDALRLILPPPPGPPPLAEPAEGAPVIAESAPDVSTRGVDTAFGGADVSRWARIGGENTGGQAVRATLSRREVQSIEEVAEYSLASLDAALAELLVGE